MQIIVISLVVLNFVNLVLSNTTVDFDFMSPTTTETTISTEIAYSSISTTDITTTLDPCKNSNFEVNDTIKEFSIILSWLPDDCLDRKYEIYLNNSLIFDTENTTVIIDNLQACSVYHIEIITNILTIFDKFLQTGLPVPFDYKVDNLTLEQLNRTLRVTWDLSDKISNCIDNFKVVTYSNYEIVSSSQRPLDLDLANGKDCQIFEVEIDPYINDTLNGLPKKSSIILRFPPETPILRVFNVFSKTSTLKWLSYNNSCETPTITTICHDQQRNIEKIVDTQETEIDFRDLSKFTKYSCRSLATNSIGTSTWSQRIEFITKQDVPSPPTNLTITGVTSNQFTIEWLSSDDNSDNITGFLVNIENYGPANHTVDDSCLNMTNFNVSVQNTTEFTFTYAFPDFQYFISIFSLNEVGESTNISQMIVTEISESEAVRNFTVSNEQLTENNTIRLELEWEDPCNSNGPIESFHLSFNGTYQNISEYNLIDYGDVSATNNSIILEDIHPGFIYNFTIFALSLNDIKGKTITKTYQTQDGVPNPPTVQNVTDISPEIFEIFWTDDSEKFGEILNYNIDIKIDGPKFQIPEDCPEINYTNSFTAEILGNSTSYQFKQAQPYFQYSIQISAKTVAGYGAKSSRFQHTSLAAKPDPIRNLSILTPAQFREVYNESATITFEPSCRLNGPSEYYYLIKNGSRFNHSNDITIENFDGASIVINLKPDYNYTIQITVFNKIFESDPFEIRYHSDPGVPNLDLNYQPELINSTISKTVILLKFHKDLFNGSYSGDIHYYAVFLIPQTTRILSKNYGFWSGTETTWPTLTTNSTDKAYQLTEIFWNPFIDNLTEIFLQIGNDDDVYSDDHLQEDTEYSIIIRGLTQKTYRDSWRIDFKTGGVTVDVALVLGLIFGIPIIIALFVALLIFKRRYQQKSMVEEEKPIADLQPISIKKFIPHYQHLIENANALKTEFQLIETQSKEFKLPVTYAILPENRRKNRYTNILPFDETRVKLQEIDEDDEISSDYINASYIKGYSGRVEYIATQGPTEATSRDFWKMILQENITVIVMVSQFIEQNKEKCFRYFPNNNEKMSFNENFEVRCLTELDFGNYCVRTIQVKKDNIQRTLTHIQYLEWPDFGVPTSTDSMLQFCYQIRERVGYEGGLIVVHCSAGVGRTGTLIAIDILLQTIDNHQDIDIFKTVLTLRQQRINMVQTEKQYMFIYSCIKDFLENPVIKSVKNEEPIYENVSIKSPPDDCPFTEIESSF